MHATTHTYAHTSAPFPTPPAPPGVVVSTIALGDLERGEGEWKNMQGVVRRSFKDCIDRLNGHQTSLDHLSQVILGVNDKLASRTSTQDVLKLLEREDFTKKVKHDGHFHDRLDKLEYSITKLAALRAELDKKSDISYVDNVCSRKVEKTDVSIRALLSETLKGDISALRAELRDMRKKLGVQETVQAQLQHSHDLHSNTLHEMQTLARELKTLKERLDSYPGFSQLLALLDRKADKSALEAMGASLSRDARNSISTHTGTGTGTGTGTTSAHKYRSTAGGIDLEYLVKDVDSMQRLMDRHTVQLEVLQLQRDQNVEDVLDRGMGMDMSMGMGMSGAGITPIKPRREDVRFEANEEKGSERQTRGANSTSTSACPTGKISTSAQLTNTDIATLLAKVESLTLDMQTLKSDNKTLRDKIFVLESHAAQAHREKELGLATANAPITGTGTAAIAAGVQSSLSKIGAAAIKAESAATKAAKRVTVVETITQQRLDGLDNRVASMLNKISTISDAVKSAAIGKREKEKDMDKKSRDAAASSVAFLTEEESPVAASMKLKEQQYHLRILSSRVDSLESAVTHVNSRLMDHTAQLAAVPALIPQSPGFAMSGGGKNGIGHTVGSGDWDTWRASVLEQVKANTKHFREEMQQMQESIALVTAPASKEAQQARVAAHVTAMGLASSAHTRAEEAIAAVRMLQASQQFSSNQPSPSATGAASAPTAGSPQAHARGHQTQHRHPAHVWIGDKSYPIHSNHSHSNSNSPAEDPHTHVHTHMHSSPSDIAAAHWTSKISSSPLRTPMSATSAALDARLMRLQQDKEDLRALSRQHMHSINQYANFDYTA